MTSPTSHLCYFVFSLLISRKPWKGVNREERGRLFLERSKTLSLRSDFMLAPPKISLLERARGNFLWFFWLNTPEEKPSLPPPPPSVQRLWSGPQYLLCREGESAPIHRPRHTGKYDVALYGGNPADRSGAIPHLEGGP